MPTITDRIIRLTPSTYVHVCDNNTNITRVIVGPVTFTRMDHEEIVLGPEQLVTVPKGSYAVVTNPAVRGDDGQVVRDASGQPKLKHGDREVRFAQEPFPLYPGEALVGKVAPLEVVNPNEALHLRVRHGRVKLAKVAPERRARRGVVEVVYHAVHAVGQVRLDLCSVFAEARRVQQVR